MLQQPILLDDKVAVVIGRVQLPHLGHQALLRRALEVAPTAIMVLGSANRARDVNNPFTEEERVAMVRALLTPEEAARVHFLPVRDYFDNARWNTVVHREVRDMAPQVRKPILVSCRKDAATSYYLDHFAQWEQERVEALPGLSATNLRNVYFGANDLDSALSVLEPYTTSGVLSYLQAWGQLPHYAERKADHARILAYRKRYSDNCYRTADSIVHIGNKVLLIQRKSEFGNGLWALPGGFIDPGERSYEAALRELVEETSFPLPRSVLHQALKGKEEFDHPGRSPRGRLVTTAYYFRMASTTVGLPEVKARDDAKTAKWVDVADLPSMEREFFEDHYCILDHFLNLYA